MIEHEEMLGSLCLYYFDGQPMSPEENHTIHDWWKAKKKKSGREEELKLIHFMKERLNNLRIDFRDRYARED